MYPTINLARSESLAAPASRISIGPMAFHAAMTAFDMIAAGILGTGEGSQP